MRPPDKCEKCLEGKPLNGVMLFYHDETEGRKGQLTKGLVYLCSTCMAETYNKYPLAFAAGEDDRGAA
jgi:hypothetical protein